MKSRIMYIEQKTGGNEARIGLVRFSKSGKTLYYQDKAFTTTDGRGIYGNYYGFNREDYEKWVNGDARGIPGPFHEYWISGPKKDGNDRLGGRTPVIHIDEDVRVDYWMAIRELPSHVEQRTY